MPSAKDLDGMMAMMPAFATDDAADISATATVSVERWRALCAKSAPAYRQSVAQVA